MADPEEYVPFMIRRTYNNPSRQRSGRFRIKFDKAITGKGHKFSITYEAPDEKTQSILEKWAEEGRTNARPLIRLRNTKDGWVVAEPLDIKEP